jgi:hypothetical protein
MRVALPTFYFLSCVFVACHGTQQLETTEAAGGQKITKEFYPDGTIKTVNRFHPNGRPLGTLYHTTNGTPTYADYYDDQKRIRRTLLYRPDGTAHTSQEFDEQHRLTIETRFDGNGEATGSTFHLQAGRLALRSPPTWKVIAHKLEGSRNVVGFQIPNPADEGTADSANVMAVTYDLSRGTNVTVLAERKKMSEGRASKPSQLKDWTIYTYRDKQGETPYEIRDAFRTLGEQYGIHVRLAFPELAKSTKEWKQTLETDFTKLLETTEGGKTE